MYIYLDDDCARHRDGGAGIKSASSHGNGGDFNDRNCADIEAC